MAEIVPAPSSLVPLDDLEVQANFLLKAPATEEADDLLADHIYQIWQRRGDLHHAITLNIGKWIHHFCQRELWTRGGYGSFKESWDAEGIVGVDYATAKGWQYEWECQQRAGFSDELAAMLPGGKLLAANATLRRAMEAGDDCSEMIEDLADPEVSQEMWVDRYAPKGERGEPDKDRATIDTSTGAITFWANTVSPPLGIRLGNARLDQEAEMAWQQIVEGKVRMEWV